jgi:hypothetical protein
MKLSVSCAAALLMVLVSPAWAQSSAHYSMKRIAMVSGSASLTSSHFSTNVVGPQESPSGGASFCNVGRKTGLGFWSVLGQISVPIILTAQRNAADPLDVDLTWSGAETTFQLYRAYAPANVLDPGNLDRETTQCSATDQLAFQSNEIFYSVIKKP